MEARPRDILFLEVGGVNKWLDRLETEDEGLYQVIVNRLERVEDGNFGDSNSVGGGVSELRFIMTGPGYRLYFGEHDDIVVLLYYGTKKTQDADIKIAKILWSEYKKNG